MSYYTYNNQVYDSTTGLPIDPTAAGIYASDNGWIDLNGYPIPAKNLSWSPGGDISMLQQNEWGSPWSYVTGNGTQLYQGATSDQIINALGQLYNSNPAAYGAMNYETQLADIAPYLKSQGIEATGTYGGDLAGLTAAGGAYQANANDAYNRAVYAQQHQDSGLLGSLGGIVAPLAIGVLTGGLGLPAWGAGALSGGLSAAVSGGNPLTGALTGGITGALSPAISGDLQSAGLDTATANALTKGGLTAGVGLINGASPEQALIGGLGSGLGSYVGSNVSGTTDSSLLGSLASGLTKTAVSDLLTPSTGTSTATATPATIAPSASGTPSPTGLVSALSSLLTQPQSALDQAASGSLLPNQAYNSPQAGQVSFGANNNPFTPLKSFAADGGSAGELPMKRFATGGTSGLLPAAISLENLLNPASSDPLQPYEQGALLPSSTYQNPLINPVDFTHAFGHARGGRIQHFDDGGEVSAGIDYSQTDPSTVDAMLASLGYDTSGSSPTDTSGVTVPGIADIPDSYWNDLIAAQQMNPVDVSSPESSYGNFDITDPYQQAQAQAMGQGAAAMLGNSGGSGGLNGLSINLGSLLGGSGGSKSIAGSLGNLLSGKPNLSGGLAALLAVLAKRNQVSNYQQAMANNSPHYISATGAANWGAPRANTARLSPFAQGGLAHFATGGYLAGGTPGQADKIPAMLSDGEYVMDADSVSALGDGNNAAGAKKLDQMRQNIRAHKRAAPVTSIPPKAKDPEAYLKGGK